MDNPTTANPETNQKPAFSTNGRGILDFSDWANQPHSADERMLICNAVSDGRMPLPEYTLIDHNAKLSKREVDLICSWAAAPTPPMAS